MRPETTLETDSLEEYRNTEIGHMPKEWQVAELGEVLKLAYRYPTYYNINYVDTGVPEVRGELLQQSGDIGSNPSSFRYITEETAKRFPKVRLESGDLVISVRGTMGKIGIVRSWLTGAVITANLMRLSPNKDHVDPDFLKHLLLSDLFRERLSRLSPQTTIKTIQAPVLKSIPIPVPPIAEQQAIAAALGTVQKAIEATEKIIEATRELKRSLMSHLFTYGPVPVDEADQVPLKETETGPVPQHWEAVDSTDCVFFQEGPGIRSYEYSEGGCPIINVRCVRDGYLDLSDARSVSWDLVEGKWKHFLISEGDILVTTSGTIGRVARVQKEQLPLLMNTSVVRFRSKDEDELANGFLRFYLRSKLFFDQLYRQHTGAVIKNVGPSHIRRTKVFFPTLSEQHRIAAILAEVDHKVEAEENRRQTLEVLFKTLLHNLMIGKVRVHDVELAEIEEMA